MGMGLERDKALVYAALYASDRPLTLGELKEVLGTSSETYVGKVVEELRKELERSPFELVNTARDAVMLRLREEYLPKLKGLVRKVRPSRGMLKTLAVIAYEQPIHLSRLARLRGGHVYEHVRQLVSLGFVEARRVGRTKVLKTSKKFASYFGLEDDEELIHRKLQEGLERKMRG
ncbi:MAG: SMC-Scp complex subunit ScpB [Hadesarchaea archaeon]|nr:MAG: SMC-Scp complex subunit ScpB [Hadesarchaea archaeon]